MEFWGVEVKPGEKVKCETGAEKYLHLSQASLGESKKDKGNVSVPVYLHVDGKKLVIGTLSPDKCAQIAYDLVFEKDFELSHSWKDGSVYFTGYKTIVSDEPDITDSSEEEEEEEELNVLPPANINGKPAKKEIAAAKPNQAVKAKGKPEVAVKPPVKEDEDEDDDEEDDESDGESEDESDEEMADGDDSEEDDDEDESSEEEEEEKVTPKKDKKRPAADAKTPGTDNKKAKVVTPAGKTGGAEGKKVPHAATPYPKAGKTPATAADKSKPQTPKSGGSILCKSCSKTFGSDAALQSHTKAKHSS